MRRFQVSCVAVRTRLGSHDLPIGLSFSVPTNNSPPPIPTMLAWVADASGWSLGACPNAIVSPVFVGVQQGDFGYSRELQLREWVELTDFGWQKFVCLFTSERWCPSQP